MFDMLPAEMLRRFDAPGGIAHTSDATTPTLDDAVTRFTECAQIP